MGSIVGTTRSSVGGTAGAALLIRMGSGDRTAFAELYDRLAPTVRAIGLARALAPAAADDFVETVLLGLWRRAPEFRPETATPTSWVVEVIDVAIAAVGAHRPRVEEPVPTAARDFDIAT